MLINALCDYYQDLEKDGKVVPVRYSEQGIHYLICLNPDGTIEDILNCQIPENIPARKDKFKTIFFPKNMLLPQRTE